MFPKIYPMKQFLIIPFLLLATPLFSQSVQLFDGKSLEGWHMDVPDLEKDSSLRIPFLVRNGLLVSLGTPNGHLLTDKEYENYRLEVEYRFAGEPGNCGVLVHASGSRNLYKMFPKSIEVQMMHENAGDFWCIVEDIQVPDMEARRGPKENWGITEGKGRRILNLTDGSEKPLGEWNHMVIKCSADTLLFGSMVTWSTKAMERLPPKVKSPYRLKGLRWNLEKWHWNLLLLNK
jgi:hypothetical protein